ncbi:MAG: prepilin-type N-terminal cleavage/methylation domain-containing protein [Oscillospiraceae bacterium]|nr:prepilin-type N-terminal cleavage/methylation domain-containing protein [Oscillospiraceae bacterium]MDE6004908.1 prepilin-type N-terminal cleavage/methylation domain-containing protein [Oscillospiraceae bacterium]MDE6657106.1 prepilin-type N-terminal cleavage/methylation domain-containing protein [Oscillospiraceae bacterium]
MRKQNSRVKGFTLIELIIVIAIITVLAGILAPTMSTYYTKSRIKAANSNAKMVYNAAQTAVQKYISRDRTALATERSPFNGFVLISYDGRAVTVSHKESYSDVYTTAVSGSVYWDVADAVNNTVSNAENISWTVCLNNYIVQGCVAADNRTTNLVGYYSANRTFASERSSGDYTHWITASTDTGESIKWVCDQYS